VLSVSTKKSLIRRHNMLQKLDFTGKTALIFGASKGIGLATAKTLSAYGANVVLAARSFDLVDRYAKEINSNINSESASAVSCDVSDYASVCQAVDFTGCDTYDASAGRWYCCEYEFRGGK